MVNYLGVTLGGKNVNDHINARINLCRKYFYSMQCAGLCDIKNLHSVKYI